MMEADSIIIISTTVSILSIVFSFFNKSIQLLILRAGAEGAPRDSVLSQVDRLRQSLGANSKAPSTTSELNAALLVGGSE